LVLSLSSERFKRENNALPKIIVKKEVIMKGTEIIAASEDGI
jgi:hypothetical protein